MLAGSVLFAVYLESTDLAIAQTPDIDNPKLLKAFFICIRFMPHPPSYLTVVS